MSVSQSAIPQPSHRAEVIKWFLYSKLLLALLILLSIELLPIFDLDIFSSLERRWPSNGAPTWESHFAAWDGAHYLYLSEHGYQKKSHSCAFYPLWPMLIRVFSLFTLGNVFWSGLILANILSFFAVLSFYELVAYKFNSEVGKLASLFLLAYPGAIFLSFIYTESLFLLLITLFFHGLFKEKYYLLGVAAFLLPMTKAIGLFCLIPLIFNCWNNGIHRGKIIALIAGLLGYCTYFLIFYFSTGNPLEGFEAQRFFPNKPSVAKIFDFAGFANALLNVEGLHAIRTSLLDRLFFLVFACLLPLVFRLNKELFLFMLLAGTIPAASSWFVSYSRNLLSCFPVFIALALVVKSLQRETLRDYLFFGCITIQVIHVLRFINWMWVA